MATVIPDYFAMSTAADRGTNQRTTDIVSNTDRRDVSDVLDLLALADTPFINRIGWGPSFAAQKIEWLSEDLGPGWVCTSAAAASEAGSFIASSAGLTITTAEAVKQIQTGTVLYHYSSTDGDHGLYFATSVSAASVGTFAMSTEANAGAVATSIAVGDKIYILGALVNEASLPRTGQFRARAIRSNQPSILRQDIQISGSMKETEMYAINGELMHQIRMRLKEMQRERERLALYGPGMEMRSTTEPTINKGVFGFLAPQGTAGSVVNGIDRSTTTLTPSAMNTVVNDCWNYGADSLTFFGDINQCAKFTQWDIDRIRMAPRDKRGGGNITYWMSEAGIEIEIVPMRQVPTNLAFVVDVNKIQLRAKKNRKALMEKLGRAGDFEDWQIISEFSMEMKGYDHGQHGMFTRLS